MQHDLPPSLPRPDELSASHSERVPDFIRAKIEERGGSISFAEFMQHALYAPGLGYYAAGATKFGEAGDFVTAPEVSPVFGRVLARQCAEVKVEAENKKLKSGLQPGEKRFSQFTTSVKVHHRQR